MTGQIKKRFYDENLEFKISSIILLSELIDNEVREAVEFALNAPEPDPSELTKYIWAEN